MKTSKDVRDYFDLKAILDLGIQVNINQIPFDKLALYAAIKEKIDGAKARVRSSHRKK
jgi:hypothetical protein